MADSEAPDSGFTRRAFLRGSGAVAASGALTGAATNDVAGAEDDANQAEQISDWTEVTLTVNGARHSVRVEPRTTLLEVLRTELDLTGAKPVSGDGSSGASTVLVDGSPRMASTTLALTVRGKRIETVENLGGESPHAVPQAFVAHDAQQCGFCTPGFVMAVKAFLAQNPRASDAEIRASLNGNICRCGTYVNVLQAAIALVKER